METANLLDRHEFEKSLDIYSKFSTILKFRQRDFIISSRHQPLDMDKAEALMVHCILSSCNHFFS